MLFRRLIQLQSTVSERPFSEEVERLASTVTNPVHTSPPIHESEHLHLFQLTDFFRKSANHPDRLFLPVRYPCRCHFYAVHIEVAEQHTCYHEFLVRQERHAVSLLAISQSGVHDFHKGRSAPMSVYLFRFSHTSILSLLATRKSMSSSPLIRQSFLYAFISNCSL